MKKFRDMTDSEKLEIINAILQRQRVRVAIDENFAWCDVGGGNCISFDCYYRIPKRPMSIDWDALKDEYICAARDAFGTPYAYTKEPKTEYGQWMFKSHDTKAVPIISLKSYDPGTVEWDESLIWRPGHEPK